LLPRILILLLLCLALAARASADSNPATFGGITGFS
jgi:hypothetical protein